MLRQEAQLAEDPGAFGGRVLSGLARRDTISLAALRIENMYTRIVIDLSCMRVCGGNSVCALPEKHVKQKSTDLSMFPVQSTQISRPPVMGLGAYFVVQASQHIDLGVTLLSQSLLD